MKRKPTKNEKRRSKKKKQKLEEDNPIKSSPGVRHSGPVLVIEYIPEDIGTGFDDVAEFQGVLERFGARAESEETEPGDVVELKQAEESKPVVVGRLKRKRKSRFTIAELKQVVERAELVETHDVASPHPILLLDMKSVRSSCPVPGHWSDISKYLSRKRGLEKTSYKLPEFIAETGINKIREALEEKEANYSASRQGRERVRPKMGKLDIDYQVLHDAFFKHQTKPQLTRPGDMYYDGMEHDSLRPAFRPGVLSGTLMSALDLTEGCPPPWLINMQRHGPPPSYPDQMIPGLNCPIPIGASFGFHQGGWGKAPVDSFGTPLYGDVFGVSTIVVNSGSSKLLKVSKDRWGEPGEDESSEEEDEVEEESDSESENEYNENETKEEEQVVEEEEVIVEKKPEVDGKKATKIVDLRKPTDPLPDLYKVIQTEKTEIGDQIFGGDYKYQVDEATEASISKTRKKFEHDDLEKNFKF